MKRRVTGGLIALVAVAAFVGVAVLIVRSDRDEVRKPDPPTGERTAQAGPAVAKGGEPTVRVGVEEAEDVVPYTDPITPYAADAEDTLRWVDVASGEVLFTVGDIVRFDWEEQLFELKRERAIDLMCLPRKLLREFSVADGQGEIYRGWFMSPLSSRIPEGPTIMVDAPGLQPPLYSISDMWRDETWPDDDERFAPRLHVGLKAAGVLKDIDRADPPPSIQTIFSGWHGDAHGLRVRATLFPETFRIGRNARFVLRLRPRQDFDLEPDGFELEVTLQSLDGKFFCTVQQQLPAAVLECRIVAFSNPLWGPVFGAIQAEAAPGPATLTASCA